MPPVRSWRWRMHARLLRLYSVSRRRGQCRLDWAGTLPGRANRTCRARAAWTDFFMQLWKNIISILVCLLATACARTPPAFVVDSASIEAGALAARLQWRPDARVLEALDHGIALQFDIGVQAQGAGLWPAT